MNLYVVTQRDPIFTDQFLVNIDFGKFDQVFIYNAPNFGGGKLRGLRKFVGLFGWLKAALVGFRYLIIDRPSFPQNCRVLDMSWDECMSQLQEASCTDSDILLSVSAPHMIPKNVLERFNRKLNFHCGSLPKYAGMMPQFWQFLAGESQYTITVHEIAEEIDRGDVIFEASFPFKLTLYDSMVQAKLYSAVIFNLIASEKVITARRRLPTSDVFNRYPAKPDIKVFRSLEKS